MVLAGAVVIAAGFGVALARTLGLPGYSTALIVAAAILAVGVVRRVSRP